MNGSPSTGGGTGFGAIVQRQAVERDEQERR